ncbi:UNVERIFIED_ORG: hypothetical protein ABIC54_001619 [Burkholderia sp. 1263]
MGQKQAAYDSTGAIVAFYDSIDSPLPAGLTAFIEITNEQWQTCINSSPPYTVASGALVAPTAPTSAQLLAKAKAEQVSSLSAACGAAIVSGFTSSALGSAHTYPSNMTDQQNLSTSIMASMLPGTPADWATLFWCADSAGNWSWTSHTVAQIQQAGKDGMAAILAQRSKNATLSAQVAAASTVAAVQSVVWE